MAEQFEKIIAGAAGHIEMLVQLPDDYLPGGPVAIICHPHPLHGGTMTNKVVHTVARSFVELGLPVVRFNFRGVGKSDGSYDAGRGEVDDLLTVISWLQKQYPEAPLWLAGFSFGSYVVTRAQLFVDIEQLLLIAPPVTRYGFSEVPPLAVPALVIQGGEDEVVDAQAVSEWVAERAPKAVYHCIEGAGHFFHGRLVTLRGLIKEYLNKAGLSD